MSQTYSVLQVTPLPVSTVEYQDDLEKENKPSPSYETIGGILFDTKYAWTANGPRFTLFNSKTAVKVAAWTFGSVVKDSLTKVVCVDELRRPTGKLPLLVIGLQCVVTGGMICIFDITGSRVLRSIQINDKVTSLHVIDASYDICPLPGPLRAFDGILSVGTTNGNVLLLDICRQTCEEALSGVGLGDIRDEVNSCQVKTLFLGDIYSLEFHKQVAIKNGEHLCIHLNATNNATQHFVLKGPKGEDRVYVNKVEVIVSALHYCPQLGSLLVGYNFGAWQLWNLINLQLAYTSPIYEENVPVSHFAIQEPCDDPRAFCYVWVVYSHTEPYDTGFPVAVLYSLNYDTKEWHEGYGILYQDLTSCAVRFQMDLTLLGEEEPKNRSVERGAHCLRLQAVNKSVTKGSLHEHQEEMLTLCAIIWSGWSSDLSTGPRTYMSLFDLNQWYKEQMPSSPRSQEYETYMTRVCLSDLLHTVSSKCAPVLDVRMDINTLSQFFGAQRLEEHYHPSSLAFQLCALRECDVALFGNQGSQRSLLSFLESGGPLALIKPTEIFQLAINLGLSPLFTDVPTKVSPSLEYQREFLLDVALEQQLLGWLCRCASAWSNGSHSAAGCTLHFLLMWGWQRAQVLKQNADKLSTPLFDYSGLRLDANTHNLLSNCARQLKNLATLFEFVIQRFARFLLNPDIVKQQWESLQMVSVHLEVLQWLLNIGLLPECPLSSYPRADEFNRINAPYPVDDLNEYYNQRRTSLQTLNAEQFSTSGSLLFIDNLVDLECGGHKLQRQWENDGGDGLYPPPSLQALMRTYLIENMDISLKHCIIVYVFLDLAMTLDQSRYKSTITHLIKFPAVFHLSPSIIKITQAFWQLDHGDFATAMEQLLDPLVRTEDLKMWHHRVALKALLAQEQHNFALLYLQVRHPAVNEVQDLCTVLSLYISNTMLDEAFHFQRQNRSSENEEKLLRHFYQECDRKSDISSILYLPLTPIEEAAFMKYLQDVKHPRLKDLRILYYVQNSRFMDAFEVNDTFGAVKVENKGLHGQQNVEFRDFILHGLTDTLPEVSKALMNRCWGEKNKLWKEVERPEPFSVFVHNSKEQVKYKSTVIHAGLLKAKEIWTHPVLNTSMARHKMNASVGVSSEEMPFVNTPKALLVQSRAMTPVIYPKITKLEEFGHGDEEPSPPKRFKPSPRARLISPEMQKFISISANADVTCANLSVKLDTPVIKRKIPRRSGSLRLSDEKFSVGTPQSILKIRNLVRNSESPDSAIDSSTAEASKVGKNLVSVRGSSMDIISEASPPRKGFTLTPRKPLPRTPRPAVRFDISRTPSESSFTSNSSEPGYEIIQDKAIVHSPVEGTQKENSEVAKVEVNSGNNSLSTEEVFYTPDASSNSNLDSKEASQLGNSENDDSKVLNQQVTTESINVIMTRRRKSLIDSEPKSPRTRGSYKSQQDDANSTKVNQEWIELSSFEDSPEIKNLKSAPTSPKTPRSRRSYKGSLPEGGIRSSPRLRKSLLQDENQQLESIEKALESQVAEVLQTGAKETPVSQAASIEPLPSLSITESPTKSRLRGRRSLSRQVLENNAFSTLSDSAVVQPTSKLDLSTSQLEISYSRTETTYESKSTDNITKESLGFTSEERKETFSKSKNADPSDRSFKHHEESSSITNKVLAGEIRESSFMGISDDSDSSDSLLPPNIEEEKVGEVVSPVEQISGDLCREPSRSTLGVEGESPKINKDASESEQSDDLGHESEEKVDNVSGEEEVSDTSDVNIIDEAQKLVEGEENKEMYEVSGEGDDIEKDNDVGPVNVYEDLSSDNYGSADPEMNVFEISDDLDLNQGMCVASNVDILEIDTNYSTNDAEVFADKSDVLSNVVAVNESSLEQFEVTENNELNRPIQETSHINTDITEPITETEDQQKPPPREDNVEIIELDSSSDYSEGGVFSDVSTDRHYYDSQPSSNEEEEYEDSDAVNEEQPHSEHSDVSSEAHSTNEPLVEEEQQKEEVLSELESSQDTDSTSSDDGVESHASTEKVPSDVDVEPALEDIVEEPADFVTTSGQFDTLPEESAQVELGAREFVENLDVVLNDTLEVIAQSVTETNQLDVPEETSNVPVETNQEVSSNIPTSDEVDVPEETAESSRLDVTNDSYEDAAEDNQLVTILEEPSEIETSNNQSNVVLEEAPDVTQSIVMLDTIPEDIPQITVNSVVETTEVEKAAPLDVIPEEIPETFIEGSEAKATEMVRPDEQSNVGVRVSEQKLSTSENSAHIVQVERAETESICLEKHGLSETDILDKTESAEATVPHKDFLEESVDSCEANSVRSGRSSDWLCRTDILDATVLPASTPRTSMVTDIFEKSEFWSSEGSVNPLCQTDILDRTVDTPGQKSSGKSKLSHKDSDDVFVENVGKSGTPARRSRRLSSLQATSTQDQMSVRRSVRRSASFSFSQKSVGSGEPSTSKERVPTASSELLTSTKHRKRSNSTTELTSSSAALPTRRKRSKNESQSSKNEVSGASTRRTRDSSNMSSKSENTTTQKQPLKRKSKSIIIVAATKTKLEEYSTARRLTRMQACLLEKTLTAAPRILEVAPLQENVESDSEDSESHQRGPDIDEIDPINLLDKPGFEGKPDPDEEKAIHKSPASSIPESPIGSRLRSRSSLSNNSPKSETSTIHSEAGPSKKQKSVKRVIVEYDGISTRTRQRSKSTDEAFSSAQSQGKGSPPKLRRTQQSSKESGASDVSSVSQTCSLTEGKKVVTGKRRTRSTSEQPVVNSPTRRSERHARVVKLELPKIVEEPTGSAETRSSKGPRRGGKRM